MIIDAFMMSYEVEAVKIRLETLKDVVDLHVAVQATTTFRGEPRKIKMIQHPKVINAIVDIPPRLNPWQCEQWLRDRVLHEAKRLGKVSDIYIISDGDEIPNPEAIISNKNKLPVKLMTDYRNFYANLRAVDHVLEHQPTMGKYKDYFLAHGANNARWYGNWRKSDEIGWHLSSLGDTSKVKLETFAHTEYDTDEMKNGINSAKENMRDFLNRFDMEWCEDMPQGVPDYLIGGKNG